MRAGLVSTIIPVFNRQKMLLDSVESVLAQSYRPIEIIIVDDGSTDESLKVAKSFERKHSFIKVISIENSGVGIARETGRQHIQGEFIQYLDSDDILDKDKFTLQVEMLKKQVNAAACYGKTDIFITATSKTIKNWKRTGEEINSLLPSMLIGRWWGTSSPLYRRSVCDAVGPWQNLINEEDWEYDCRVALNNNNLCYVDKTVSTQLQHESTRLSNDGSKDALKLASRARAHQIIVNHALKFGLDSKTPEFEHLLVACFLLSRQCGAQGLTVESKQLLKTARQHMKSNYRQQLKLISYQGCCYLIGWQRMGKLAMYRDKIKSNHEPT